MEKQFPIVCVGGSAGGLDAYVKLLKELPFDTGVAIVIVNHASQAPSTLAGFLSKYTKMPVKMITNGLSIKQDHVFIIPPSRDLHFLDGRFRLKAKTKLSGWPNVITIFLRSLAHHWDGVVIAVIVSGLDSDGAEALREIKQFHGVTIAQMPETAEWSDMPDSAIKTGYVDHILPVEAIAAKIIQIAHAHHNNMKTLNSKKTI